MNRESSDNSMKLVPTEKAWYDHSNDQSNDVFNHTFTNDTNDTNDLAD